MRVFRFAPLLSRETCHLALQLDVGTCFHRKPSKHGPADPPHATASGLSDFTGTALWKNTVGAQGAATLRSYAAAIGLAVGARPQPRFIRACVGPGIDQGSWRVDLLSASGAHCRLSRVDPSLVGPNVVVFDRLTAAKAGCCGIGSVWRLVGNTSADEGHGAVDPVMHVASPRRCLEAQCSRRGRPPRRESESNAVIATPESTIVGMANTLAAPTCTPFQATH
jgi:hypothetical protein